MGTDREIAVVGAGIGGLTAALALHARGVRTTVVERAGEVAPPGAGITLQPYAVGELTALGLGEALASAGAVAVEHVYTDHRGRRLRTEPRGAAAGCAWPQYGLHRGELRLLLLAAVRDRLGAGAVRTGTRLETFDEYGGDERGGGVRYTVTDRATGLRSTADAAALIGADGVRSVVRARLHPGEGAMRWSGVRLWRGVAEAERFLTGRSVVIAYDGGNVRFVAYPVSARRPLVNWVCTVREAGAGPLIEGAGWNREAHADDVLPQLAGWSLAGLGVDVAGLVAGSGRILEHPMADRDPLDRWGRGRVTLLGDAAHPVCPTGANGGSLAVADAGALAGAVGGGGDGVGEALARYEAARIGPAAEAVHTNRKALPGGG
ncbi:FAD-dependent monooxygenase [Streptomyces sp. NPDC050504]|uniref:FAD-dependent monooxygenase n=1 Tax=Streptomyces sp. NPDC050504 TaxID=3365618 RepID=UPI0037B3E510